MSAGKPPRRTAFGRRRLGLTGELLPAVTPSRREHRRGHAHQGWAGDSRGAGVGGYRFIRLRNAFWTLSSMVSSIAPIVLFTPCLAAVISSSRKCL